MDGRSKILEALGKDIQRESPLPVIPESGTMLPDPVAKFTAVLESIGGNTLAVDHWDEIDWHLNQRYENRARRINLIPELRNVTGDAAFNGDAHQFENVTVTIIRGHFGVAENGAVWITDDCMGDRALPFICEHLAVVIRSPDILPTLHDAYTRIGKDSYDFGTFIAGPSKTADIEQSLVLGAHGPKSMTVFLMRR